MAVDVTNGVVGIVVALGVAILVLLVVLAVYCKARREAERVQQLVSRHQLKSTNRIKINEHEQVGRPVSSEAEMIPVGYQRRMYLPSVPAEVARPQLLDGYPVGPEFRDNTAFQPDYFPRMRAAYSQPSMERFVDVYHDEEPTAARGGNDDQFDEELDDGWRVVREEVRDSRGRIVSLEEQPIDNTRWRRVMDQSESAAQSRNIDRPARVQTSMMPGLRLPWMMSVPSTVPAQPQQPVVPAVAPAPLPTPVPVRVEEPAEVTWTAVGEDNGGSSSGNVGFLALQGNARSGNGYVALGDLSRSSENSSSSWQPSQQQPQYGQQQRNVAMVGRVTTGDVSFNGGQDVVRLGGQRAALSGEFSWHTEPRQNDEQQRVMSLGTGAAAAASSGAAAGFVASAYSSGVAAAAVSGASGTSSEAAAFTASAFSPGFSWTAD